MNQATHTAPLLRDVVRLYVRAQRAHAACDDGASTVQCHVMTELLRQQGLSQQTLVARLGLDKAWISRAVDALVAQGAVSKQTSARDRRSVTLTLTELGRARAGALEQAVNSHAHSVLERIPAANHAQLHQALQLLQQALSGAHGCAGGAQNVELTLRPAEPHDWPAIDALLRQAGLPLDGAREQLGLFLIGQLGAEPVCAGALELYGNAALLRSVVVKPQLQGRHYGKQLIGQLLQLAIQRGATELYLLTTSAQAYFSALGFAAIGRDAVAASVQQSQQFHGACPASATAMRLRLDAPAPI